MKPLIYILCLLFFSCSGVDLIDDYVPPTLRISNAVEELPIGSSFELRASYFNNVGELIEEAAIQWVSLNHEIISIESNGTATPIQQGTAQIVAQITSEEGVLLESRVHWIKPLYNGTLSAESSDGSIFANNVESMILGGEMAFQIGKKWGVSATLTQPLFGKVVFKAPTYSGGIFFNL